MRRPSPACIVAALALAAPASAADLLPLRVKPTAESPIEIPAFKPNTPNPFQAGQNGPYMDVRRFAISSDGRTLVGSDATGWMLETWDVRTGKSRGTFGKFRHSGALSLSPDGTRAVTAEGIGHFGAVVSWDIANERMVKDLDEGANASGASAGVLSPDGKTFLFARTEQDMKVARMGGRNQWRHTVGFWDVATGTETRVIRVEQPPPNPNLGQQILAVTGMAFTPDGRGLAVILKDQVQLWETATGKPRLNLGRVPFAQNITIYQPGYGQQSPAYFHPSISPDGSTLAIGYRTTVFRWDLHSGEELAPIGTGQAVRTVQFTADGKQLLALTEGWKIKAFATNDPALKWTPPRGKLTPAELDTLWTGLTTEDPSAEFAARQALAADPERSVAFLKERITPVANLDQATVKLTLAKCISQNFNERKKGVAELRAYGDQVNFILNQYQQYPELQEFPYELRNRITIEFNGVNMPPESLRLFRAVQVLETIPGAEASKLLDAMAGGAAGSRLTTRAKEAVEARKAVAAAPPPPPTEMEAAWKSLRDGSAAESYVAFRTFESDPAKGAAFLKDKLITLSGADQPDLSKKIERWIVDLEANAYAVRSAAVKELRGLGKEAEKPLQDAAAATSDTEARRLIDELLKALESDQPNADRLRATRGIEALERLPTPEARAAMKELQYKAVFEWFKDEAGKSLARMK